MKIWVELSCWDVTQESHVVKVLAASQIYVIMNLTLNSALTIGQVVKRRFLALNDCCSKSCKFKQFLAFINP